MLLSNNEDLLTRGQWLSEPLFYYNKILIFNLTYLILLEFLGFFVNDVHDVVIIINSLFILHLDGFNYAVGLKQRLFIIVFVVFG